MPRSKTLTNTEDCTVLHEADEEFGLFASERYSSSCTLTARLDAVQSTDTAWAPSQHQADQGGVCVPHSLNAV